MRISPPHAVIVDLDGTMIDTVGDFIEALNRSLHALALPPVDRAFVERTVGKGSEHLIRSTLQHVGADAARYGDAWALYQRHYLAINGEHAAVYPVVLVSYGYNHGEPVMSARADAVINRLDELRWD